MLTDAIARLPASPIGQMFDRAAALRAEGRDLIDFSVGEPSFDTPDHICEAAVRAIRDGATRYTATDGTAALKAAIQRKFARDNDLDFAPDQIVVASGAKPLLAALMLAVVGPGDEVIITSPYWSSHPGMAQLCGATPVVVETGVNDGFKLSAERLAQAITPKTRLLILCSPSNPTGAVYGGEELAALAEILRAHPQALALSDDLYEHIRFNDQPFATLAAVAPDLRDRVFTVNGVSKCYAMTGWRIGYGGGPVWWCDGLRAIFSQSNGGPCSISQAAATAALDGPQDFLDDWRAIHLRRRNLAMARLGAIRELRVDPPAGAFFLLPHCGALLGRRGPNGAEIADSGALASHFLNHGVALTPGAAFGRDPYFRLSFTLDDDSIAEGLDRVANACAVLR